MHPGFLASSSHERTLLSCNIYCLSCVQGEKAYGSFILTASHNPGGPHEVMYLSYLR